jgi:hypothetical protein
MIESKPIESSCYLLGVAYLHFLEINYTHLSKSCKARLNHKDFTCQELMIFVSGCPIYLLSTNLANETQDMAVKVFVTITRSAFMVDNLGHFSV